MRRGIASELFGFYKSFPESLRTIPRRFIGSGNGIRESQALRRALADAFGAELQVPRHREEASFGAALLAGIASGRLSGVAEAGALIRFETA